VTPMTSSMNHRTSPAPASPDTIARRHTVVGWWLLLVFLVLGSVLEILHGLKIGWYVDVSNSTRRLMFTLAHAHGSLVGLINIAFASTIRGGLMRTTHHAATSACLLGGSILLPGGFFLGGLVVYGGDPGLGVYLTPLGAVLLLWAIAQTLRGLRSRNDPEG